MLCTSIYHKKLTDKTFHLGFYSINKPSTISSAEAKEISLHEGHLNQIIEKNNTIKLLIFQGILSELRF